MIYNREESEVSVLGEVQKYKVGIDERNINHIVTILSSNLYSHPMTSFLRETVSNAVDSHIEAKSDEPIIIQHTSTDLSIRDFGTGISPERFNEIYLNIGSSTKRESNDYIGNFGIGRFSCLSVADIANITSFYEGKAYYYVMNKDVDQLHIDLLDILPTKEPNGVEVKIPLNYWDTDTLECISFIDNLYVETDVLKEQYDVNKFNQRKIYTYKNFKLLSPYSHKVCESTEILLGKIPYKVDYLSLWDYSDNWHRSWSDCFEYVYPQVEIGQVDITPNREGLLYSERTKAVLRQVYDNCIQELTELWDKECTHEYESIKEYMKCLTAYTRNKLVLNDISIPISDELSYNAAYKKHKEWEDIPSNERKSLIETLYRRDVDMLCKIDSTTVYKGERAKRWFTVKKLFSDWLDNSYRQVIAVPSAAGFSSQYFKGFVNEKYDKETKLFIRSIPRITPGYIRRVIREMYGVTIFSNPSHLMFVVQLIHEVLLYFKASIDVTDIMGSKEYEQYKKDHCVKNGKANIPTEEICFTISKCSAMCQDKHTTTLQKIIPYIKERYSSNSNIVYADLDNPFISAFLFMGYPHLVILSAAKNKMPLLRQGLPDWVKPIESLYSPDNRVLQKYATMRYILNHPDIDKYFCTYKCFPKPVNEMIVQLRNKSEKYNVSNISDEALSIIGIVPFEKFDREIMALWYQTRKWLELGKRLGSIGEYQYSSLFKCYFLMKNKRFRLDWDYYQMIRDEINKILKSI